jgi:hypothetical protein
MTSRNDLPPEMRRQLLERDTLERLLAGRVEPDDAPPGYAEVARVLRAAAAPIVPADLANESEYVEAARILVTRRSFASDRSDGRPKDIRSKGNRLKVAGLVVLGTLLGTSGLAVAGVLPDTAQDLLSNVLDRVGISVPTGDHPASSGEQISETATTTDSTGVGKGAEISSIASDGMSQAGEHGSAEHGTAEHGSAGHGADAAPVSTPNKGGTSTADAASGGHSEAGTDIADERSNGRSAAGSGSGSGRPSQSPSHGSGPPSQPPSHGSPALTR